MAEYPLMTYIPLMADQNKTERVQLLMSPAEVEAIDDWGFSRRIRTRAEAIRRLVALGLEHAAWTEQALSFWDLVEDLKNSGRLSDEEAATFNESIRKFGTRLDKAMKYPRPWAEADHVKRSDQSPKKTLG